jgi:hypothetical protein
MIQIKPILVGLPQQEATAVVIRPIIDTTTAIECNTYYEVVSVVFDEEGQVSGGAVLASGNYPINEEQYAAWGADNSFIEDIVLSALGLERL